MSTSSPHSAPGRRARMRAMADQVVQRRISKDKMLQTVHIARFAMATRSIGDAEPVFDALTGTEQ